MVKVAIVGAGQAGLQLGLGLLKSGHQTTLVSDRTPEQIYNGYMMSNQAMFSHALECERKLGLQGWEEEAPKNISIHFSIIQNKKKEVEWTGYLNKPFYSVDQRIKFSAWLTEFSRLGGNALYCKADEKTLEDLADSHDLVIASTGKGDLSQLFSIDKKKTIFEKPQRALACFYAQNVIPITSIKPGVRAHILPGVGEFFVMPGLTKSGHCEMLLFEGLIGGVWDCWDHKLAGELCWNKATELLGAYIPEEAIRCKNASLTDEKAFLIGKYTPVIRHPTAALSSGKYIFGMGDAIVLNDPIAGQGANNASKCADLYLTRILNHVGNFDKDWMEETFELYWEEVKWATAWTNMLLTPPLPHIEKLLKSAQNSQKLANEIAQAFDDPKIFLSNISNQ